MNDKEIRVIAATIATLAYIEGSLMTVACNTHITIDEQDTVMMTSEDIEKIANTLKRCVQELSKIISDSVNKGDDNEPESV